MSKSYVPNITIRRREIDNWYGAECPDCGANILDTTIAKVKNGIRDHGNKHNWKNIKFYKQ